MLNLGSVGRILLAVAAVLGVVFLAGVAGETVGDLVSEGAGQIAAVVFIDVVAGGALVAIGVWVWRRHRRSRKANPDQGMNVQDVTPILNVANLQESFAWFEQLGWKKHWKHGDPPTFGAVISGNSEIFLCQGGQGARGGPMPREPWDNQAGSTWMTWWLRSPAEVDTVFALALKLGVVAPFPPTDMPWNVHECHIRHPDGHTIRVSARLEEKKHFLWLRRLTGA